jgi:pimeloyl-ACP methyl ester carboxylesterase/predicted GNAT family N-acyltransferase
MKAEMIRGDNGYAIPCLVHPAERGKPAVVICHGLGSSKESSTGQALRKALGECGIGTYCFDFPAHGDSPAGGEMFRVAHCVSDLAAVAAYAQSAGPQSEIGYFASSFGAYINLIYLSGLQKKGSKAFLRCAAVDMPGLFRREITPEREERLDRQGFFMLDEGYVRPLKITRAFLEDLGEYDVFRLYRPGMNRLAMIHGTADDTVPIADVRRFAARVGAPLIEIEGADHRFLIPGGMERVLKEAVRFFDPEDTPFQLRVRPLEPSEICAALNLVWQVFLEFEAPDYAEEGVAEFKRFIDSKEMVETLALYGAFAKERMAGVAATRNNGNHIALLFVDSRYHRRGVARKLFETVRQDAAPGPITVNSSPYAAEAYRRLGFQDTDAERLTNGIRYIPMKYEHRP